MKQRAGTYTHKGKEVPLNCKINKNKNGQEFYITGIYKDRYNRWFGVVYLFDEQIFKTIDYNKIVAYL